MFYLLQAAVVELEELDLVVLVVVDTLKVL